MGKLRNLFICYAVFFSTSAHALDCSITRFLPDGSQSTTLQKAQKEIRLQGENETETITLQKTPAQKWLLTVATTVDGAPYITDSVSCDRFLSCKGLRNKISAGKTQNQKLNVLGGNHVARIQVKERLLFTFFRKGTAFVYTYLNYPLPTGSYVGVELSCDGR